MRLHAVGSVVAALVLAAHAAADPPSEAEMAARIDARLAEACQRENVQPAPLAEDPEFLRRAWLDLCGTIPPINDPDGISGIRGFLKSTDPDKRIRLVERLLARPSHATHFANVWKNVLLPQDADIQRVVAEAGFQSWLRGQFADNVPYDTLIADLVLAQGQANQPGPALFYTSLGLKPEELAASTSRAFLGTQIQCAQCHDHPFDHWKKADFWGYAAFFAQLRRASGRQPVALAVADDQVGEVTLPDSKDPVTPRFLGGETSVDGQGKTRRQRLVQWLTWPENPFVARAAVNRVWALLFGRGLVHPVDDLGQHNASANPELLAELADYFVRTGYDLNCLVRTLARTKAYQRTSRSLPGDADRPELFARMAIKSLTAEQLFDCLSEAMRRREDPPQSNNFSALVARTGLQSRQAFLARFRAPTQGATEYEGGIPQALTLMNGAGIRQATHVAQSDLLVALDAPFFTTEQRVEVLFLSTLSRPPRDQERSKFVTFVERSGSGRQALGDVLWALLNSAEFMLNH
jgi:hypothetical protein